MKKSKEQKSSELVTRQAPSDESLDSKALLCAKQYELVLTTYSVCIWHIPPQKAKKYLSDFYSSEVICSKLAEEGSKAGCCFRKISKQLLDLFLYDTFVAAGKAVAPLKEFSASYALNFFNRAWARYTIQEALLQVLQICEKNDRLILYKSLLADLNKIPYAERFECKTLREMYAASKEVRVIFSEQMETALLKTISDSRLVMQEWQELHLILPDLLALDPEMAAQLNLSVEDLRSFWQELINEEIDELNKTVKEIIHLESSSLDELQKIRKIFQEQKKHNIIPIELSEAMNYACLAAELLKINKNAFNLSNRKLNRGFFWLSKQSWVDEKTVTLAEKANEKLKLVTSS